MDNNAVSRELVVRVVRGNYRKVPPEIENHMDSAVAYKAVVLSHAKRIAAVASSQIAARKGISFEQMGQVVVEPQTGSRTRIGQPTLCREASCSFAPIVTFSLWPELGRFGVQGLPE